MADCAILVIAAATETAHALIQRLVKVVEEREHVVPWTIANKYYTAEVKFVVHPLAAWDAVQDGLAAPALVFVWNRGEPYRDQIRQLASQHEFEVALAVRLPPTDLAPAEVEDDQDTDAYLSSQGFEFVDVEASSPDRTGIPGVPRIVDALSTIMWPSMVRHTKRVAATTHREDDYHNLVQLVGDKMSGNDGDRLRRELEELELWLDEDTLSDDADNAIPWSTAVTPGTLSPALSGFFECSRPTTPKAGFDDDFTSFISGSIESIPPDDLSSPSAFPPITSVSFTSTFSFNSASSAPSTPISDDDANLDAMRLAPGESYKSLGSVSDFGDQDKQSDDQDMMPSQTEIADTSRMIFGDGVGGAPSKDRLDEQIDAEMTDATLERFDLQSVLGVLQGLKEEIASMPDKERRKAAARVALGLAYGLGGSEASGEHVVL